MMCERILTERVHEMMKKRIGILLMMLGVVGVSSATSILWCSDGTTRDQGWVDLLAAEGYVVDRLEGSGAMDTTKRDLANTYDLVIVGRDTNGGSYVGSGETGKTALWNSITAPMICQSSYILNNGRWKWLNSGGSYTTNTSMVIDLAASDPLHEVLFSGVTPGEDGAIQLISTTASMVQTASAGNGILVGHRNYSPEPWVWIAYWNPGVEFYSGAGLIPNGPRMAFFAGDTPDSTRGAFNLNDAGTTVFLNAVYYMSGATFNRKPLVNASDRIANVNEAVTLQATAFDPDSTMTFSWTQLSGPAAVAFDDATVLTPTVTFPVKGTYQFEIEVADGTTTIADQVTVTVRDNADNALIARWDFEGLPDPNTLIDVTGNGFDGIYYGSTDPNVAAGNMIGGSKAADFTVNQAYWEVPNSYDNADPNFNDLATGMTVATWVKISDNSVGAPMIIGNGLDGWRLQVNVGSFNLACKDIGLDFNTSGINAYDGLWHHVVGVYDGAASQAHIYVDGQLAATAPVSPGSLLAKGDDYPLVQIANRGDADRPWKGFLDDMRIYNYPLSGAEIASLALEGNLAVSVTAGEDQTIAYKGVPIQLDGALVSDDGFPAYATVTWSVVSVPFGTDPAGVLFSDAHVVNPEVTFPHAEGVYILRLTADDTEYTDFDDVNFTIQIPSCADVIADGYGIAADLSGPADEPDCHVDLYDLAALANSWLDCNDPDDANCDWAYQQ